MLCIRTNLSVFSGHVQTCPQRKRLRLRIPCESSCLACSVTHNKPQAGLPQALKVYDKLNCRTQKELFFFWSCFDVIKGLKKQDWCREVMMETSLLEGDRLCHCFPRACPTLGCFSTHSSIAGRCCSDTSVLWQRALRPFPLCHGQYGFAVPVAGT